VTLYSLWLSLNFLASALIRSLFPPVWACQNWISVTASAPTEYASGNAATASIAANRVMRMLKIMELLLGERNRTGNLPLLSVDSIANALIRHPPRRLTPGRHVSPRARAAPPQHSPA
jgi:hypothetical protein